MFAIGIELLAGRYVSTAYNDREAVEWPPHPGRLFSALVATWADGEPDTPVGQREREALQWLERQSPPDILASSGADVAERTVAPVFVPVNDVSTISAPSRTKLDEAAASFAAQPDSTKLQKDVSKLLDKLVADTAKAIAAPTKKLPKEAIAAAAGLVAPERRSKQPRTFPSATPAEPAIAFVWPDATVPPDVLDPIRALLSRLVRLGHSSTLVRASVLAADPIQDLARTTTRFIPDLDSGDVLIRWVSPGQMDELIRRYERHLGTEPRVLPARYVRYSDRANVAAAKPTETIFDPEFIVLRRVGGPRLPIVSAAGISRQLRHALMSVSEQPVPELLSGHKPEGQKSESSHLAIVPLPFVGREHADGAILGLGLILPRDCDERERRAVHKAIGRLEQQFKPDSYEAPTIHLDLGNAVKLELQRVQWDDSTRDTVRPSRWSRPSELWASVTPVALDRNPGDLHDRDAKRRQAAFAAAEQLIRDAVARVIPELGNDESAIKLLEVDVIRSAAVPGTAKPRAYPRFPIDQKRPQRVLVHVRLVFNRPVRGPLLLGAGRYQGLGLCAPVFIQNANVAEAT